MQSKFTSHVCASSILVLLQAVSDFDTVALPANAGVFTCKMTHVKKPHTQFTCVTCSLPVETGKFTYFYAASTSRRIHAIARNKARRLRVTSPAGCRLTYLHFVGEFTRGVIADCLQLQVILRNC